MTDQTQPILVLGGTGKTGRRVAERLRPAACRCASARAPASRRSTGRTARPGRPRSRACGSVYLTYYPDLAVPGAARGGRLVRRAGRAQRRPAAGRCCPAAASPRPSAPSRPCATPAPT